MLGSPGPCAAHRTPATPRVGTGSGRAVSPSPSLSAGSLLDFLKSDEGKKQPLPKLIDFSAQVRREQTFPSSPLLFPLAPVKGEWGDRGAQELTRDLGSALFEQANTGDGGEAGKETARFPCGAALIPCGQQAACSPHGSGCPHSSRCV